MTTIALTPAEVKQQCSLNIADAVIQNYITSLNEILGDCLSTNYQQGTAKLILNLAVCHLASLNSQNRLTGFRTPNGTSENYQAFDKRTGLALTGFGQQLLQFDIHNCVSNAFNKTTFIRAVGRSTPPRGRGVRRI